MRSRGTDRRAPLFLLTCLVAGCAPALPSFAGGRTVPVGRTDLAIGGAVRVPVGTLVAQPGPADDDLALAAGAAGGVAPVAFVRHGLGSDADVEVQASGSIVRLGLRGQLRAGSFRFLGALVPHAGLADLAVPSAVGRVGAELPLVVGIDVLSALEVWVGLRVGLEHLAGDAGEAATPIALSGLRTGGVVGFAVGFRRVHVLLELGVDHELWWGSFGGVAIERNGVALTPAFAIRARL